MSCLLSEGGLVRNRAKRVESLNHWTHDQPLEAELACRCAYCFPDALRLLTGACHCSVTFHLLQSTTGLSESIWSRPERWKQELSWICRDASVLNC
jgi:hypothetical protein